MKSRARQVTVKMLNVYRNMRDRVSSNNPLELVTLKRMGLPALQDFLHEVG